MVPSNVSKLQNGYGYYSEFGSRCRWRHWVRPHNLLTLSQFQGDSFLGRKTSHSNDDTVWGTSGRTDTHPGSGESLCIFDSKSEGGWSKEWYKHVFVEQVPSKLSLKPTVAKGCKREKQNEIKMKQISNVLVSKVSWKSTKVPLLHWLQSIDWPICRRTPGRAGLFACSLGSRGGWSGHAPFGKVSLLLAVIFVWRMNVNLWNGWLMFAKAEASMWPLRRLRFQGISLAQRYVAELIDQAGVQWCANGFSCRYKPWSVVEKFLTFGGNSLKHDSCKCLAA